MSWASRRKIVVFVIIFTAFLIVVLPVVYFLYPEASCSDGKMNQDEKGVDCGGICQKVCTQDIFPVSVLWSRAFEVSPGVYNAVAYVTNPNINLEVKKVPFLFELYDSRNVLVLNYRGTTSIPPGQSFPIFVGGISSLEREVSRALFSFTEETKWEKAGQYSVVKVLEYKFENSGDVPRLEAKVRNETVRKIDRSEIVAILYDSNGNSMASSATFVEDVLPDEERSIFFTWRKPFENSPSRIEIYPISR